MLLEESFTCKLGLFKKKKILELMIFSDILHVYVLCFLNFIHGVLTTVL